MTWYSVIQNHDIRMWKELYSEKIWKNKQKLMWEYMDALVLNKYYIVILENDYLIDFKKEKCFILSRVQEKAFLQR